MGWIALAGFLCFGTAKIAGAVDYATLSSGGDGFDTAVTIEAGNYSTDHEIEQNILEYFKISVGAGQRLEVKMTTPAGEYPYAGAAIYDYDQEEVVSEVIIGDSNSSETIAWVRSYEDSGTYYVAIGNEYDANATGTKYVVSLDNYYDADAQTDIGGTFDTAYEIDSTGTYQGYITTEYGGSDLADLYKLRVAKGVKLTATVTPPSGVSMGVSIYNSEREEIAEGLSSNDGAIASAEMSEALTGTDDLYIKVHADYESTEEPIGYALKISSGGSAADEDADDEDGTEDGTAAEGGTASSNTTLIIIGAAFLVLAGVFAFAFLTKKKGSTPAAERKQAEDESHQEEPKEENTES